MNTLGLKNCFCDVELRYDSKGRTSIIEVNPRVGGIRLRESLLALRGVDFAAVYVQQLLGKPFNFPEPPKTSGYYARSAVYPRVSGFLKGTLGTETARQLPGVLSVNTHIAPVRLLAAILKKSLQWTRGCKQNTRRYQGAGAANQRTDQDRYWVVIPRKKLSRYQTSPTIAGLFNGCDFTLHLRSARSLAISSSASVNMPCAPPALWSKRYLPFTTNTGTLDTSKAEVLRMASLTFA